MRTPVIAGNWKMNMTLAQAKELVQGIHYGLKWPGEVDVVVAPSFICLATISSLLKDSYISVAAQNMHAKDSGAYTGEISPLFIKDAGVEYIILGHSERRQYFEESDQEINQKIKAAFHHDLIPIFCIGETLEERESGQLQSVISTQLFDGLAGLIDREVSDLIIAYEPVWAIGTGKTATPFQAEEVHELIRALVAERFGSNSAEKVRILYGGSVKPSNAKELLALPNIDGALVGGASLKASDFIAIIQAASL